MPLTTEMFVMSIFIAGLPFFYGILRDHGMKGRRFFILGYIFLTMSNIFTVIEEFFLNYLFNIAEHTFIALGSIMMLMAVLSLTSEKDSKKHP